MTWADVLAAVLWVAMLTMIGFVGLLIIVPPWNSPEPYASCLPPTSRISLLERKLVRSLEHGLARMRRVLAVLSRRGARRLGSTIATCWQSVRRWWTPDS